MSNTYTGNLDPTLSLTSQPGQFFPDNDDRQGTLVEISALPAGTSVDNIFFFNGTGGNYLKRVIDGPIRAAYCGIYDDTTDQTSKLNAALAHTDITEIVFDYSGGALIQIDGTVNVPAGKMLNFRPGNIITGDGTINGGFISADKSYKIFDTSITLTNVKTTDDEFSGKWFGALGSGLGDDYVPLQKALDYVCTNVADVRTLYIPGGTYPISKGLFAYRRPSGTEYNQINIKIYGITVGQTEVGSNETILKLTNNDNFCLGIQEAKGAVIENLVLQGTNTIAYDTAAKLDPETTYIQGAQRTNQYSPYAGLVLDPFSASVAVANRYPGFDSGSTNFYTNSSNGGSTTCTFRNIKVSAFVVGVVLSPSGGTQNNEGHHFEHFWLQQCREGFVTCNSQERTVKCSNFNAWSNVKYVFANDVYGDKKGEPPIIDTVNAAGAIFQFCKFNYGSSSQVTVSNVYCEELYRIGYANGYSVTFLNCEFKMADVTGALARKLPNNIFTTTSGAVFVGCIIIYFVPPGASRYPLNFYGRIKFFNCQLNQQVGINYFSSSIYNYPGYERINFYAENGFITGGNLLSTSSNYYFNSYGAYKHYAFFGMEITTFGGGVGITLSNGWKAKQIRRVLSPLIKRNLLGNSIAVTVTGNTATATISSLAGVTAYDNALIYSGSIHYDSDGVINIQGAQVMRLVSVDGSGVCTFDRLIEGMISGNYQLHVEQITVVSAPFVANISGTNLSNVTQEIFGTVILTNGGLYYVYGNAPVIVTSSSAGAATISANTTGEGERAILCDFEYEEWGFSDRDPLTNPLFPTNTVFTKGAFYKNINGTSSPAIGWRCTRTGVKGTSIPPEFEAMRAEEIVEVLDSDGSINIPAGDLVSYIIINPTNNATTFKIGTTVGGGEIEPGINMTAGNTYTYSPGLYFKTAGNLYFTNVPTGTQIVIKKA